MDSPYGEFEIGTPAPFHFCFIACATNFSLANIDFVNFTHVAPEDQAAFDASFTRPTVEQCRLPCQSAVQQGLLSQESYDHLLGRPTMLQ